MTETNNSKREFLKKLYIEQSVNMFRYANSSLYDYYLAEEAVQETFMIAWEKIESLIKMESPVGWLFGTLKITMKRIKTGEYKLKRNFISTNEAITEDTPSQENLESTFFMDDVFSHDDYSILEKIYLHGYSYNELAEEMELPLSTVGMRVKRAKEKFKKNIEE